MPFLAFSLCILYESFDKNKLDEYHFLLKISLNLLYLLRRGIRSQNFHFELFTKNLYVKKKKTELDDKEKYEKKLVSFKIVLERNNFQLEKR